MPLTTCGSPADNGETANDEPSVLVVDDSPKILRFSREALGRLNIRLRFAVNGRDAWRKMRADPPDILITDIMMPVMDGFELIETVRKDEDFRQTYIIVMTGLEEVEFKVKALGQGADDYTVKPLDLGEFQARVQTGLREVRLRRELTGTLHALDRELQRVAELQQRLLPKTLPQGDGFETAVLYEPCLRAGGDYYDCFLDQRQRYVVAVADVSGHGASAAVLTAVFRALLRVIAPQCDTAAAILARINEELIEQMGDEAAFVTAFLAIIQTGDRIINYCNAGQGNMVLWGPEASRTQYLLTGGTVLGSLQETWRDGYENYLPGQFLLLYTDGLIEAVNAADDQYGRKRLETLLNDTDPGITPVDLVGRLRGALEEYIDGGAVADDISILTLKFT